MTSVHPTCLVDTNLLVYAVDPRDAGKQRRAITTLDNVHARHIGVLSPQILGEFFSAATRKLPSPLTPLEAERLVADYIASWPVLDLTATIVQRALRGLRRYQFSYWDALVWATACENGLSFVLSEDFNDGAMLEGVRFLNPFNQNFALERLQ